MFLYSINAKNLFFRNVSVVNLIPNYFAVDFYTWLTIIWIYNTSNEMNFGQIRWKSQLVTNEGLQKLSVPSLASTYFHMHFWHFCRASALTPNVGMAAHEKFMCPEKEENLWHFSAISFCPKLQLKLKSAHLYSLWMGISFYLLGQVLHPYVIWRKELLRSAEWVGGGSWVGLEVRSSSQICLLVRVQSAEAGVWSQTAICQARDCV